MFKINCFYLPFCFFLFPIKAFAVLYNTTQIGTPDQPTIEGGLLNTAISQSMPNKTALSDSQSEKKPSIQKAVLKFDSAPLKENKSKAEEESSARLKNDFSKNFVSDKRVVRLLNLAAKEGKLSYVLKKAEEKGLPASVAIIPMIESAYRENALSPKGAAGVWQLMPSVAKDYGIDKASRFDFKASTDVALDYLSDLQKKWGNWQLTLAAYNAGSHRVLKAIRRRPTATHIHELDLPKETKNYVKQIEQAHTALAELNLYGT